MNDRKWPTPDLHFNSKHLKVFNLLFYNSAWDLSSAGEHYAEDVGVPGSTPGGPIYILENIYKTKIISYIIKRW